MNGKPSLNIIAAGSKWGRYAKYWILYKM